MELGPFFPSVLVAYLLLEKNLGNFVFDLVMYVHDFVHLFNQFVLSVQNSLPWPLTLMDSWLRRAVLSFSCCSCMRACVMQFEECDLYDKRRTQ